VWQGSDNCQAARPEGDRHAEASAARSRDWPAITGAAKAVTVRWPAGSARACWRWRSVPACSDD